MATVLDLQPSRKEFKLE
ncbi:hypothetical protein LSH36_1289g00037 [Paralvinella palmiformis]|uniref:Uncharacterized protein n=1 Tax=Paralvinella palmiformis TaxID=53620 RepID=A0AAD9MQQ5_9ANNE|nr:hypothetical protein LSH36_1289g00037 [Paralvinella palmiformis]